MMNDNIKGLKLIAGIEMIAKIVDESATEYVLEKALFWDLVQVSETKYDVQFFALTNGAKLDENANHNAINVSINKNAVMFCYDVRDEIVAKYRQYVTPILLVN